MMRSLFSGVAGLKTHQTKMDVIGNNIANVNTTAYKSQAITFNELMYQTTKRASGANLNTGGTNANQIGLGVKVGAIGINITSQGATQTTNLPFDLQITGSSFFIVNNGQENFFTRAGSFYVDGAGNLAMTSTGYNVMGWQVDETTGEVRQEAVSKLQIMSDANMTYPAEATTRATISGIADKLDPDINSTKGKAMNLDFYDSVGYKYTAKLSTHVINGDTGEFYVQLDDIIDANGQSIGADRLAQVTFGGAELVNPNQTVAALGKVTTTNTFQVARTAPAANFTATSGTEYTLGAAGTPTPPTAASLNAVYGLTGTDVLVDGDKVTFGKDGTIQKIVKASGGTPPAINYTGTTVTQQTVTITDGTTTQNFNVGVAYSRAADADDFSDGAATPTSVTAANLSALFGDLTGIREVEVDEYGVLTVTSKLVNDAILLNYQSSNGNFLSAGGMQNGLVTMGFTDGGTVDMSNFEDIVINFSPTSMSNKNQSSTLSAKSGGTGDDSGLGAGRPIGDMLGVVVQDDGRIYANYSNGQSRLLGQIATAAFANASGLEKKGDNLYSATLNSGEFDGIGQDIKDDGGYMTSGVLEMSNVDLSSEFTEMITTQRGFQANSRIITVSDTLLEELTNLKR